MYNQHCKWLEHCEEILARTHRSLELPDLLHRLAAGPQRVHPPDPGFMDLAGNKKGSITRVYLPADANSLLAVAEQALTETNVSNIIVSDKQKHLQYLTLEEARRHVAKGIGIWDWACNDDCGTDLDELDVVLASAGDIPPRNAWRRSKSSGADPPAESALRQRGEAVLAAPAGGTYGLKEKDFTSLFTPNKPVIFNFHGYRG